MPISPAITAPPSFRRGRIGQGTKPRSKSGSKSLGDGFWRACATAASSRSPPSTRQSACSLVELNDRPLRSWDEVGATRSRSSIVRRLFPCRMSRTSMPSGKAAGSTSIITSRSPSITTASLATSCSSSSRLASRKRPSRFSSAASGWRHRQNRSARRGGAHSLPRQHPRPRLLQLIRRRSACASNPPSIACAPSPRRHGRCH
jgi:hypothetical protein